MKKARNIAIIVGVILLIVTLVIEKAGYYSARDVSAAFLNFDIIACVVLQCIIVKNDNYGSQYYSTKTNNILTSEDNTRRLTKEEGNVQMKFQSVFDKIEIDGFKREVKSYISNDEAGKFLLEVCEGMSHAPMLRSSMLHMVIASYLVDVPIIIYELYFDRSMVCQNVLIVLVKTKSDKLRMFVVETSFGGMYMLCEYINGSHMNYGPIEIGNVISKIENILDRDGNV